MKNLDISLAEAAVGYRIVEELPPRARAAHRLDLTALRLALFALAFVGLGATRGGASLSDAGLGGGLAPLLFPLLLLLSALVLQVLQPLFALGLAARLRFLLLLKDGRQGHTLDGTVHRGLLLLHAAGVGEDRRLLRLSSPVDRPLNLSWLLVLLEEPKVLRADEGHQLPIFGDVPDTSTWKNFLFREEALIGFNNHGAESPLA